MRRFAVIVACFLAVAVLLLNDLALSPRRASADECSRGSLRGNLLSSGDQAKLTLRGSSYQCRSPSVRSTGGTSGPVYAFEVLCEPDSEQGPRTLCSVAPCLEANLSFALRSIRLPDGSVDPAGYQCLNPTQTEAAPGLTLGQVYAAIRNVKLPGGKIYSAPATRGLANLRSFFWVDGTTQQPVELSLAGSVLYAEFRVVEYRWTFGGDRSLITTGPGTPGLGSEVSTTFKRRGKYRVGVTVMWVAEAFLDGRRVGEVDDLVSRAQVTYPVAELRTVLTG
jgi:PKD domain